MSASYDTITVPAGGSHSISLGSGDVLENTLIDVTADEADLFLSTSGTGWEIRNVGILGEFSIGSGLNGPSGNNYVWSFDGSGTITQMYMGDGIQNGLHKGAGIVDASNSGRIDMYQCNIGGWSTNAIYAAGMGRLNSPGVTDGGGGTFNAYNCYFHNNNIASLRIASGGTEVHGCVFENTNEVRVHPELSSGKTDRISSRAIYTGYGDDGQKIDIRNCDFEITDANTCSPTWSDNGCFGIVAQSPTDHGTYGMCSELNFTDCQIVGSLSGNYTTTNVGSNPTLTPPSGVPMDAYEAAGGTAPDYDTLALNGTTTTAKEYTLVYEGDDVQYGPNANTNPDDAFRDTITDNGDGTFTIHGYVASAADDFYLFGDGTFQSVTLDDGITMTLNGATVTAEDLAPSGTKSLVASGVGKGIVDRARLSVEEPPETLASAEYPVAQLETDDASTDVNADVRFPWDRAPTLNDGFYEFDLANRRIRLLNDGVYRISATISTAFTGTPTGDEQLPKFEFEANGVSLTGEGATAPGSLITIYDEGSAGDSIVTRMIPSGDGAAVPVPNGCLFSIERMRR